MFILKNRSDRIGTLILSILYQLYYCNLNNCYLKYNKRQINFQDSIFIKKILFLIDDHNEKITSKKIIKDKINIIGIGGTDMCYGMGKIVSLTESDMLTFFKTNYYNKINKDYHNTCIYNIPFDIENSIVIHLRLDDQWKEKDYDGSVCSNHYINLINNKQNCKFTNGPGNNYNKQNPLSGEKIKIQLNILKKEFPNDKIVIISSPLTKIQDLPFKYDLLIQSEDFNRDLFILSKSKKIILSRSNFCLVSLLFGEQTHIHMPLWGHFACAGFGTKYDKCKFNYFY